MKEKTLFTGAGITVTTARSRLQRLASVLLIASTSVAAQTRDADVNTVGQCVAAIQQRYECQPWVSVQDVRQIDRRVDRDQGSAVVIAEIDLRVLKTFDATESQVTRQCTGTRWGMAREKVRSLPGTFGFGRSFLVGQELMVRKSFLFQKFESGWRCATTDFGPLEAAFYTNNKPTAADLAPPPPVAPNCTGDNLRCGYRCYNPKSGQACSGGQVICTPEGKRNLVCW